MELSDPYALILMKDHVLCRGKKACLVHKDSIIDEDRDEKRRFLF